MYASIKSALILALLGFLLGSVDGFYYNLKPTAIHRQALRSKAPAQLVGVAEQQATSNVSFSFTSGLEIRRSLSLFSRQELQCEPGYCKNWRIHRLPLGLGDNLTVKLQTYALTIYVVRTVTTASPTAVAKAPTNSAAVVTAMTQRQRFAVQTGKEKLTSVEKCSFHFDMAIALEADLSRQCLTYSRGSAHGTNLLQGLHFWTLSRHPVTRIKHYGGGGVQK